MSIMDRLKKNTKLKHTSVMSESTMFGKRDMVPTDVPMLNVALSGDVNGGLTSGVTIVAGPSRHFKTAYSLLMAAAYLKAKPQAVLLFYDSEFGSPQAYFETWNIDTSRVLHTPITNVEELKHDLVNQLQQIEQGDDVIIVIDSIGNLASMKEVEDAVDGKQVADMTRAKAMKSLFRMITPMVNLKDIPLIAIAHTYKTMEIYSKDVVSGGTGLMYSADTVWIVGRRQNKNGTEVEGYDFIINVEKSRFVREKSKIPITVSWDGGIDRYSGVVDLACAGGFIACPSRGWFSRINLDTGEVSEAKCRAKDIDEQWITEILESPKFQQYVANLYQIGKYSANPIDFEEAPGDE